MVDKETLTIQYLMGQLPPDERADFERRFFTAPDFSDWVKVVEEQIICDALKGELTPDQQDRFQNHFLSFPDLRRKYEATKALQEALAAATVVPSAQLAPLIRDARGMRKQRTFRLPKMMGLAACVIFFVLGLDDVRLRLYRAENVVVPFTLEPGPIRAGAARQVRLSLPAGSLLVRIIMKVELSDKHSSYRAILRAVDSGQERASLSGLVARPAGAFRDVALEFPTSNLSENYYTLTLFGDSPAGFDPVEAYSFQVVHGRQE
jgi:hypothetical protein